MARSKGKEDRVMKNFDLPVLIRTKAPMSHMSGTAGNVSILNTTKKI